MCGGVRYFTPCYFVVNNESCVVVNKIQFKFVTSIGEFLGQ
jgi:hypothetical protein